MPIQDYTQQVSPEMQNVPQVQVTSQIPPDAFGMGIDHAAQGLGHQAQTLGHDIVQRQLELQQEANNRTTAETLTLLSETVNGFLQSTETDEKGISKGYLNRQGKDAAGITGQYDIDAHDAIEKFSDILAGNTPSNATMHSDRTWAPNVSLFPDGAIPYKQSNPAVVQAFRDHARQYVAQMRQNVVAHEAAQNRAHQANVAINYAKRSVSDAPLIAKDGASLKEYIRDRAGAYEATLVGSGLTPEMIDFQKQQLSGAIASAAVNGMIDQNAPGAQTMFDAVKESIPGDHIAAIQRNLDGKALAVKIDQAVSLTKDMVLSDGYTPDLKQAREAIETKYSDLNSDERQKIIDHALPQLRQMGINANNERAANMTHFQNDVIALKNQGGGYQSAVQLATKPNYGETPLEQKNRLDFAKRLYMEPEPENDKDIENQIFQSMRSGRDLNTAKVADWYKKGLINSSLYNRALDWQAKQSDDGTKKAVKTAMDTIQTYIATKYPSGLFTDDPLRRKQILSVLNNYAVNHPDASAADLHKFADDILNTHAETKVPNQLWRLWSKATPVGRLVGDPSAMSTKRTERWKAEYANTKDTQVLLGNMTERYGNDVIRAMGNDSEKVLQMAHEVDPVLGLDYFKPGSPGSNAVKSLLQMNELVTPDNIKEVIRHTKGTGIIQGGP